MAEACCYDAAGKAWFFRLRTAPSTAKGMEISAPRGIEILDETWSAEYTVGKGRRVDYRRYPESRAKPAP